MQTITSLHCQQCGSTSLEDVGPAALAAGDGYTPCCNERAIYPEPIQTGLTNWATGRPVTRPFECDPAECSHD